MALTLGYRYTKKRCPDCGLRISSNMRNKHAKAKHGHEWPTDRAYRNGSKSVTVADIPQHKKVIQDAACSAIHDGDYKAARGYLDVLEIVD